MSEWSHLPNAVYIDQILVHVKTNPEKWEEVNGTMYASAWNAAWSAVADAAVDATAWNAWNAARDAVGNAARDAVGNAARAASGAILALIAYPDCAYMLNMTPEQIKIYAGLDVKGALLMIPAVIAMNIANE